MYAHCDIPCGIYDPEQARIEAESCYKIIGMYQASDDANFKARCIYVKEERAELAKRHPDVLWHDYFKPEHLREYPDLHESFWKATKQAGEVKRSLDLGAARELLSMIDTIDENEDTWQVPGKLLSAYAEGAAVLLAGVGLLSRRRRPGLQRLIPMAPMRRKRG